MVYLTDRREGLENLNVVNPKSLTSERTREFIGTLFSTEKLHSKSDSLPESNQLLRCTSNNNGAFGSYFWGYENNKGGLTFIWSTVYGLTSTYQIKTNYSGIHISQLLAPNNDEFDISSPIELVDEKMNYPNLIIQLSKQKGSLPTISLQQIKGNDLLPISLTQQLHCSLSQ